jgi:type IV pilus assembly protein PilM
VATLLLGCTIGYLGKWREWNSAREDDAYKQAFGLAENAKKAAGDADSAYKASKEKFDGYCKDGQTIAGIGERQLAWAEMLKAVNECLPRDEKPPADISERNVIYVDSIDCEYFADLKPWIEAARTKERAKPAGAAAAAGGATPPPADAAAGGGAAADASSSDSSGPPNDSGWVIAIQGHHYHNKDPNNQGAEYVRQKFIRALREKNDLVLGDVNDKGPIRISTKQLGIEAPVIAAETAIKDEIVVDPNVSTDIALAPAMGGGVLPAGAAPAKQSTYNVRRYNFTVEFAWKPTPLSQREANRKKAEAQKKGEPEEPKVAKTDGK